jgi:hypothetical protein
MPPKTSFYQLNELGVLVDDDQSRAQNFHVVWEKILTGVFPRVDLRFVNDIEMTKDILRGRPHILILDNVFPDKKTNREVTNKGLDFVVAWKDKYPDCIFVLYTGKGFQIDTLGNKFPNPDILVTKTSLPNLKYQGYIRDAILHHLKRYPVLAPVFSEPKDGQEIASVRDDLHSILEQCLLVVQDRVGGDYVQQVNLSRLGGGYSGSHVFLTQIYGSDRYRNLPFVLKVAKGTDTANEVSRYNRFVRLQMPHDMRVDLLGSGATGELSGALYAFAFGKVGKISSATDMVESGDFSFIETVTGKLFLSDAIGWYKDPKFGMSVEDFYSNSEEYAPSKDGARVSGLRNNADDIFGAKNVMIDEEHYAIDDFRFDHVRRQLSKFHAKMMPEVISHGDFNTNNIIFSADGKSFSTIDFEYTGYDFIYKDFVSLESSVRTYWRSVAFTTPTEWLELYLAEKDLLGGSEPEEAARAIPAATPYLACVAQIRDAAKNVAEKCNVSFDLDLYTLALAFHMLKLNGLRIWDESGKIKLLACLFAVSDRLQNIT